MKNSFLMSLLLVYLLVDLSIAGAPDNEGTEFIFPFGSNERNSGGSLEVFVTTRKTGPVAFNFTSNDVTTYGSVSAGEVVTIDIDTGQRMSTGFENIEAKCQVLMAEQDVIAYASNKQSQSADAYLVLPTDVLGTTYVVPAWATTFANSGTMIVITPVSDNTNINITLRGTVIKQTFTLQQGEVYQYLGVYGNSVNSSTISVDDVTGAVIMADKPIAVLSGNRRAHIGSNARSSDHIVEMIPPINTLGTEFLISTFYERGSDIMRIIAAEDNLVMNVYRSSTNSTTSYTLNVIGEYEEIYTDLSEVLHVNTSGAAIVAQYAQSAGADNADSDPMMALVPPKEQYGNYYTFTTPTGVSSSYRNYVNIIMPDDMTDDLHLDDVVLTTTFADLNQTGGEYFNTDSWVQSNWTAIGDTGYAFRTIAVLHGTHSIYHSDPTVAFYAMMYGQVIFESYGFPAGCRLASIGSYCTTSTSVVNDGLDNDCDGAIDEELQNGVDDDGDGQIDEDISESLLVTTTDSMTSAATTTTTAIPTTPPTTSTTSPTVFPTVLPTAIPTGTPTTSTTSTTVFPTVFPTATPTTTSTTSTTSPTVFLTVLPTAIPTATPTTSTTSPTVFPTVLPTATPTTSTTSSAVFPTVLPTAIPTGTPTTSTTSPTVFPTVFPTATPTTTSTTSTTSPTVFITVLSTAIPTATPTTSTTSPTVFPTVFPTATPTTTSTTSTTSHTVFLTVLPTAIPTATPTTSTTSPTVFPTVLPTATPTTSTTSPTVFPTVLPTATPTTSTTSATVFPTVLPTATPTTSTTSPTVFPTVFPTATPTIPTTSPTTAPTTTSITSTTPAITSTSASSTIMHPTTTRSASATTTTLPTTTLTILTSSTKRIASTSPPVQAVTTSASQVSTQSLTTTVSPTKAEPTRTTTSKATSVSVATATTTTPTILSTDAHSTAQTGPIVQVTGTNSNTGVPEEQRGNTASPTVIISSAAAALGALALLSSGTIVALVAAKRRKTKQNEEALEKKLKKRSSSELPTRAPTSAWGPESASVSSCGSKRGLIQSGSFTSVQRLNSLSSVSTNPRGPDGVTKTLGAPSLLPTRSNMVSPTQIESDWLPWSRRLRE